MVLLPGRLTRWKGQLVFLSALALLKREGRLPKEVRAVIAGDAQGRESYVRELKATIAGEGLEDVVQIANHITDMPAAYLAADIVVSASTDPEAFGRVPPEAAAMGRPVIATDHGGARETVLNRESGLLVEPNSGPAMAGALSGLLARTPAELAAMGGQGPRPYRGELHGRTHVRRHARPLPHADRRTRQAGETAVANLHPPPLREGSELLG